MSSKGAAGRGSKQLLVDILMLISTDTDIGTETHARKLYYMTSRGYIARSGHAYTLTTKGKNILNEEKVWSLSIPTPPRWDKKWRVVLFDIPADKRKRRDIFRLRLKELGLTLYQNSVWVYPYPLEKVVREIAGFYHLSNCVSFITAESLTGEQKLRSQFGLK